MKYILYSILFLLFSGCTNKLPADGVGIVSTKGIKNFTKVSNSIGGVNHILIYQDINKVNHKEIIRYSKRSKKLIVVLKLNSLSKNPNLKDIKEGKFDEKLKQFVDFVSKNDLYLTVRPFHEINGNWYDWGIYHKENDVNDFIPAWKRVYNILSSNSNIKVQLNLNR